MSLRTMTTFNFRDRDSTKPKGTAIEIAAKMCEIHCEANRTEEELKVIRACHQETKKRKRVTKENELEKKCEAKKVANEEIIEKTSGQQRDV